MTIHQYIRLFAFMFVALLFVEPASAFWNLFENQPGKPSQKRNFKSPLEDLRNSQCEDSLARNKFGETEFMRGKRTRHELSRKLQRAIAGAYIAETPQDASIILNPHLSTGDRNERAAARIGLAFALLRKAAGDPKIWSDINELVSHADVADRIDAIYIKGTLALYERNWNEVKSSAKSVLEREPQHYNANVLRSLAILQSVAQNPGATRATQCQATLARMIDALAPVMALGACPTQVAHLDVTSERYLTFRDSESASKQHILRQLILAYVSRNGSAARAILTDYQATNGARIPCYSVVRALKLMPVSP